MSTGLALFLKTLPRNIATTFLGWNLLWHALAIGVTAVAVFSGFDWSYFSGTREINEMWYLPAVVTGAFLPFVAPVVLLAIGYGWRGDVRRREAVKRTGFAIGQAAVMAWLISSAYKAVTGRTEPPLAGALVDNSHAFSFGFMEYGVFWGWPSGHTTTAFAMVVTLVKVLAGHTPLKIVALCYAFYIGLGISISIHWFSDFAAGAIIGSAIGIVGQELV